jgi:hypothetical protein
VNYDSDYEIQDDIPSVPVDIDPYAGLSSISTLPVHVAEVQPQAFSFPRIDARKLSRSKRSL